MFDYFLQLEKKVAKQKKCIDQFSNPGKGTNQIPFLVF